MLFYQTCIFLIVYFFLSCNALLCTTDCYFKSSLKLPLTFPAECYQKVSAGMCRAQIQFWYEREEYDVSFQADPSNSLINIYNNMHVLFQFLNDNSNAFSYTINRACKNKDDCARDLITYAANDMLQRYYNYSAIINELQPLIFGPPLTPNNPDLRCYNSNQNIQQCGTSTKVGSCAISDTILKKKISVECDTEVLIGNKYVSIYQSNSDYISFDVHCNRSLCNTQSTLQAVKELMFKHNVTKTLDGRLSGSQLIISTSLMIMMIFALFSNRF